MGSRARGRQASRARQNGSGDNRFRTLFTQLYQNGAAVRNTAVTQHRVARAHNAEGKDLARRQVVQDLRISSLFIDEDGGGTHPPEATRTARGSTVDWIRGEVDEHAAREDIDGTQPT